MNTKIQSQIAAAACAAIGALSASGAQALQSDSLSGPSGFSTIQSALTVSGGPSPETSNPYVTYSRYDDAASHDLGNSRFNASYSLYDYVGAPTGGTADVFQTLSADATAFGTTKNVLYHYQEAYTSVQSQSANLYWSLYAAGSQLRSGSRQGGDFIGSTALSNVNQKLWSASQNFTISIIPVTVSAAVYGSAYQSVWGHMWVDGVDGTLSSGVRAWVKASAGVGRTGASAGIRVDNLNLLDVSIPLIAKARYSNNSSSGSCVSDFTLASKQNLVFRFLNGQLKAYAEFLFWDGEYLLASWPGFYSSLTAQDYGPAVRSGYYGCISVPAAPQIQGLVVG
jgi:hypothetical protein